MRKCFWGFLIILLIDSDMKASEPFAVMGLNTSRFHDDASSKLLPGFSVGYGREARLTNRLALTYGLSFFYRGTRVEKKIIYSSSWISFVNMNLRIGYLEIPFLMNWYFTKNENQLYYFSTGLVSSLAIYDGTQKEIIKRIDTPDDYPEENSDYCPNQDPDFFTLFDSSAFDVLFCFGIKIKHVAIESGLRYNFYGDVDTLKRIASINSQFVSLVINFRWSFSCN